MHAVSLSASIDGSTWLMKQTVIPLAVKSLDEIGHVDFAARERLLSRLKSSIDNQFDDNNGGAVLSLSFDPKKCGIPFEYCNVECMNCRFNPLTKMMDPYESGGALIITSRNTIDLLLSAISFFAESGINALLRETINPKNGPPPEDAIEDSINEYFNDIPNFDYHVGE